MDYLNNQACQEQNSSNKEQMTQDELETFRINSTNIIGHILINPKSIPNGIDLYGKIIEIHLSKEKYYYNTNNTPIDRIFNLLNKWG